MNDVTAALTAVRTTAESLTDRHVRQILEEKNLRKPASILRCVLRVPLEIVVAIYIVLDGVVAPIFRPAMRFLSSLALIKRLERTIGSLPPYLILGLLVVPFGIAELAKVYALVLIAEDHVGTGAGLFIGAYVVSILVCERTFHAGKDQLMKIVWFKAVFEWVMQIKEQVLGWFRQTRIWRSSAELRRRVGGALWQTRERLQALVGRRPKRSLERP